MTRFSLLAIVTLSAAVSGCASLQTSEVPADPYGNGVWVEHANSSIDPDKKAIALSWAILKCRNKVVLMKGENGESTVKRSFMQQGAPPVGVNGNMDGLTLLGHVEFQDCMDDYGYRLARDGEKR